MSNSTLTDVVILSPNCNKPRNHVIDKITIHHMAGFMTVEQCGNLFADPNREGSSNYGIDSNGRVGLYVEEANRAWTSGSPENDNRAITIEVANDSGAPDWHVSDTAYAKLIDLCVDICKRNGISALNWTGDANGNLTCHYMFQATACPGPYLKSKMPAIAAEVNARLGGVTPQPTPTPSTNHQVGETVTFNKIYASSSSTTPLEPAVTSGTITKVITGANNPYLINNGTGWVNDGCIVGGSTPTPAPAPTPVSTDVNVYYRVKTQAHGWLPEVRNLEDFAGYQGSPVVDIAVRVDRGSIWYQGHVLGGGWLGRITGYDINDFNNGYAGDDKNPLDAIIIYYQTPEDIINSSGYKKAVYKVNNFGWQHDDETSNGQDGYAGLFGTPITELRVNIENA